MIITAIIAAFFIALGALAAYMSMSYAELKGYERGLDEAEQIAKGVRDDGRISEHDNREG